MIFQVMILNKITKGGSVGGESGGYDVPDAKGRIFHRADRLYQIMLIDPVRL